MVLSNAAVSNLAWSVSGEIGCHLSTCTVYFIYALICLPYSPTISIKCYCSSVNSKSLSCPAAISAFSFFINNFSFFWPEVTVDCPLNQLLLAEPVATRSTFPQYITVQDISENLPLQSDTYMNTLQSHHKLKVSTQAPPIVPGCGFSLSSIVSHASLNNSHTGLETCHKRNLWREQWHTIDSTELTELVAPTCQTCQYTLAHFKPQVCGLFFEGKTPVANAATQRLYLYLCVSIVCILKFQLWGASATLVIWLCSNRVSGKHWEGGKNAIFAYQHRCREKFHVLSEFALNNAAHWKCTRPRCLTALGRFTLATQSVQSPVNTTGESDELIAFDLVKKEMIQTKGDSCFSEHAKCVLQHLTVSMFLKHDGNANQTILSAVCLRRHGQLTLVWFQNRTSTNNTSSAKHRHGFICRAWWIDE